MRENGLDTITYKTGGQTRRAVLCILVGAAILLASLSLESRLGLLPFSLSAAPTAAPEKTQSGERETRELALSAHSWYALQLGAFTQENAARQLAQEFINRGAAGYVYHDSDAYRVLAAAYPTRAEAQSVQQRLNDQSVSTYIHPFSFAALTLRAGGEQEQVRSFSETLSYLDGLDEKLYALSTALDAREMEDGAVRAALLSEGATCQALLRTLSSAFGKEPNAGVQKVCDILTLIAAEGDALGNENSAARTGAALKRCQLTVFFGLLDFTQSL